MKTTHLGFLAALALVLAAPVGAQTMTVDFVAGPVEIMRGTAWERLAEGAHVGPETRLRLGEDAFVEILGQTGRLTLGSPGLFLVSDLLARSAGPARRDVWRFLENVVTNLLKDAKPETVILGARAAEVPKSDFEWVDEDEVALLEGRALIDAGRFEEAVEHLQAAEAQALEPGPFRFLSGYAHALSGRAGRALQMLSSAELGPTDPGYEDWLYLRAQLLYESGAHRNALDLAETLLATAQGGRHAQAARLVAGLSLRELGRDAEALAALGEAVDMDPESVAGRAAAAALRP